MLFEHISYSQTPRDSDQLIMKRVGFITDKITDITDMYHSIRAFKLTEPKNGCVEKI